MTKRIPFLQCTKHSNDNLLEVIDGNEGGGGGDSNVLDSGSELMIRRRFLGILLVVGGVAPVVVALVAEGPERSSVRFTLQGVAAASVEVDVETGEEGRIGVARAGCVAVNQKSRVASR